MSKSVDITLIQPIGWSVENPPFDLSLLKGYLPRQNITTKCFNINNQLFNLRHKNNIISKLWNRFFSNYIVVPLLNNLVLIHNSQQMEKEPEKHCIVDGAEK